MSDVFDSFARTPGAIYPADDSAITSTELKAIGNMADLFRQGLERFSGCYRAFGFYMLSYAQQRSYGMEAYPDKLRELVLECYDEGLETAEIAKRFKVSCD